MKRIGISIIVMLFGIVLSYLIYEKETNKEYKYTYMNPTKNTIGKSHNCYSDDRFNYCYIGKKRIIVEEYWY